MKLFNIGISYTIKDKEWVKCEENLSFQKLGFTAQLCLCGMDDECFEKN